MFLFGLQEGVAFNKKRENGKCRCGVRLNEEIRDGPKFIPLIRPSKFHILGSLWNGRCLWPRFGPTQERRG